MVFESRGASATFTELKNIDNFNDTYSFLIGLLLLGIVISG